jgi:hypothetical protein
MSNFSLSGSSYNFIVYPDLPRGKRITFVHVCPYRIWTGVQRITPLLPLTYFPQDPGCHPKCRCFPRCSQGRHGAGVMNGKPACQMLLTSSTLSRCLEHKIKHTNDRGKRKEDTRRKNNVFLLAFRAIP